MLQKVLKVGSSAAVTIPKRSLEELGLSVGDRVRVAVDPRARRISVEVPAVVDAELVAWTKRFIEKYRPALEALAAQ